MTHLVRRLSKSLCVVTIVLSSLGVLDAQEFRGMITGQVSDPSGAVIPNATITAVKEGTQQTYTAKTTGAGIYSIPYVLPGDYTVIAEATGFKQARRRNVTVEVNQKLTLNIALEVGTVTQVVTVTESTVQLATSDASIASVIDPVKVQSLPLNGRQVYMLMSLTPGIRFTQYQFGSSGFSGTRGWDVNNSYQMNGVVRSYNQFSLNGAPITTQTNGTWQIAPNVDGVQEFNIRTNNYDAQYGRYGGGSVNIVMKSGSNAFHGTAFDYLRNNALDANTFQNNYTHAPVGKHIVNQFGGTVGGRIQKDKTFFFFSFEGWREVVPFPVTTSAPPVGASPNSLIQILPDGSVNFTNSGFVIYDPTSTHPCAAADKCGSGQAFARTPFLNDTIPFNRIDPTGMKLMGFYPAPNVGGTLFNNLIESGLGGRYRYNQPIVRIDRNFGDKTRLYGLFTWWLGHEFRNSSGFTGPAQRGDINSERDDTNIVVDTTRTFSPSLVGDLRLAYGRFHSQFPSGAVAAGTATLTAADLNLNMPSIPTTSKHYAPQIQVDQYPDMIGNTVTIRVEETFDLAPSLTQIHGRHTLHYGGEFMLIQHADPGIGQPNGIFHFGPGFTQFNPRRRGSNDGFGLASLLLGYPDSGSVQWNTTYFGGYPYYSSYIQDDFKIRRNLTFNLGLRWDDEVSVQERFNRINGPFCFSCTNPVTSQINYAKFPNLPNPIPGGMTFAGVGGIPRRPYKSFKSQWQPKFGFAWSLNPKTVLRGGYGINYAFGIELDTQNGFNQSTSYINSLDGGLTPTNYFLTGTPYPNGVIQATGSSLGLLTNVGNGFSFDQSTRRIPRVQQWSLGFQRELPGQIVLDMTYVGTYTNQLRNGYQWDHLTTDQVAAGHANPIVLDQNVSNPFFGVLPANSSLGASSTIPAWRLLLPYPEFNNVYENTNPNGFSNYHALQMKATKKVSGSGATIKGLTFITAFTYSKTLRSDSYLDNGNIQDPKASYFLDSNDRTWDLAFSGVWGVPIGQGGLAATNAKGALGALINSWSLDWIFTDSGGTPFPLNNYLFGGPNCPNTWVVPNRTYSQWIYNANMSCYQDLPEWTPRTTPFRAGYIRNPWAPQLSLALQKQWRFMEGKFIQFRAESFNFTNTPIFFGAGGNTQPDTNIHDKVTVDALGHAQGFGTYRLTEDNFPRQVQLSLKIIF